MAKKTYNKKGTTNFQKPVIGNPFELGYRLGAISGKYDGVRDIAQGLPHTKENAPILAKVSELCVKAETWFKEFSAGMGQLVNNTTVPTAEA